MIPNSLTKNSNLIHSPCQGQGHTWQRFPGKEDSTVNHCHGKEKAELGAQLHPKENKRDLFICGLDFAFHSI